MQGSPQDEVPARAVLQAAEQHGDRHVDLRPDDAAMVAAQRKAFIGGSTAAGQGRCCRWRLINLVGLNWMYRRRSCVQVCSTKVKAGMAPSQRGFAANSVSVAAAHCIKVR